MMINSRDINSLRHLPAIQFAPVAGVQIYEQMKIRGVLGHYHLLLAHDILDEARRSRYEAVFQNLASPYRTIILDNSVVELKTPIVEVDRIIEAAKTVKANVIVLPDVYEDSKATVESCKEAYEKWTPILQEHLGVPGVDWTYMMVPQGKTVVDYAWCAEQFSSGNDYHFIGWWGIARNIVQHHGTRKYGIQICRMLNSTRDIHMLGFSDNVIDDILVARNFLPRGIDSAVPVRIASDGYEFSLKLDHIGPRPSDWLQEAEYVNLMQQNIITVKCLLNG